ncbi:MAG TPA: DUF3795 domain-containing protein [Prolixibacteraceae bacterium]|nr:DUF3795 domain-containing protein [Prolixibacteraceae bacterium]
MKKQIACCGLDCTTCDAWKATLTDDNTLRTITAENWKVQFSADITPEMINCTGCREEGVKFAHCAECKIRNCVKMKGFETCADCGKLDSCELIKNIHQYVPDALLNLKSLN